jgi:hypothetical protein
LMDIGTEKTTRTTRNCISWRYYEQWCNWRASRYNGGIKKKSSLKCLSNLELSTAISNKEDTTWKGLSMRAGSVGVGCMYWFDLSNRYLYRFGRIINRFPDIASRPWQWELVHVRGSWYLGMLRREPLGDDVR